MVELLSKYKDKFKSLFIFDNNNQYYKTFQSEDIKSGKEVLLKLYDKKLIDNGPRDLLLKQIKREEELTKKCKCENVIELFEVLETDISFIFVYELCYKTLSEYLIDKMELMNDKDFFIKIVCSLAEAIKVLNEQNIIHRNIKPNNIYIKILKSEDFHDVEKNCIL